MRQTLLTCNTFDNEAYATFKQILCNIKLWPISSKSTDADWTYLAQNLAQFVDGNLLQHQRRIPMIILVISSVQAFSVCAQCEMPCQKAPKHRHDSWCLARHRVQASSIGWWWSLLEPCGACVSWVQCVQHYCSKRFEGPHVNDGCMTLSEPVVSHLKVEDVMFMQRSPQQELFERNVWIYCLGTLRVAWLSDHQLIPDSCHSGNSNSA